MTTSLEPSIDTYERSFESAQSAFDGAIDMADRSGQVLEGDPQEVNDFLAENGANRAGFYEVPIEGELLRSNPALYVGRALLMPNPRLVALSPTVITMDPKQPGRFQITMFDQPYDPAVGFSTGMHFGISTKSQTRIDGFGACGDQASGLEQGHFSAAILGVKIPAIGSEIVEHGDHGSHGVIDERGVAESMGASGILPVMPITRELPATGAYSLMAYWHEKLQTDTGPAGGDFPEATRLMLGAGLHAIGENGLPRLERLVKDAARGA